MSDLEKNIDLIDKKLKGLLTDNDELAYQHKLRNEPDFAALANDLELIAEAVRRKKQKKNFAVLQTLENSLPPVAMDQTPARKNKAIPKRFHLWATAASILILVSFGSYYFFNVNKNTPDQIYEQYFQIYPSLETERERGHSYIDEAGTDNNNAEENAYSFYEAGNYDAAIKSFKVLLQLKNDPKDYFFLGNAYMANNNFTEAIDTFRKLADAPSDYKDRANWYLALAYLKIGKTEKAVEIFEIINNTAEAKSYRDKAAEILEEII